MQNIIIKSTLGAGLFAELKNIMQWIYICYFNNNQLVIDFSQEYFPYKTNNKNICEFHNILNIRKNLKFNDDLHSLENNLFHYDKDVGCELDGFDRIHYFRLQNNKKKTEYLKKLNLIVNISIEINDTIINEVNLLYSKYKENFIIGIHYRGAGEHNCEVSGTSFSNYHLKILDVFKKIDKVKKEKNIEDTRFKVYLATDVITIQNDFKEKYKDNLIINKNNTYMMNKSTDPTPPHFGFFLNQETLNDQKFMQHFHNNKPGLDGAKQLFIDCLMLSKCNYFIPSLSNLSDFVLIFNPDIEYSYYNQD